MKATGARAGHGRSGPRARPAAAGTVSSSAWATTRRSATTLVPAAATSSPVDACSCRRRWFLLRLDQTSPILNRPRLHKSDFSFFLLMLSVQMVAGRTDGCGGLAGMLADANDDGRRRVDAQGPRRWPSEDSNGAVGRHRQVPGRRSCCPEPSVGVSGHRQGIFFFCVSARVRV